MRASTHLPLDPVRLDVAQFAQNALTWAGQTPLSKLERIHEEIQRQRSENADETAPEVDLSVDGLVRWWLQGSTEAVPGSAGARTTWVSLRAETQLPLVCQRCLQPLEVPLALERRYRFVATERQAEALDGDTDDFDVLVISKQFDFMEVLEDELLMALPMSQTHEVCPSPVALSSQAEAPAPRESNPFSALAALKRPSF